MTLVIVTPQSELSIALEQPPAPMRIVFEPLPQPFQIVFEPSQGSTVTGNGGDWGEIGGTLSAQTDLQTALNAKQATLVSGTNIKTVNGTPILGAGDIEIIGGGGTGNAYFPSGW